MTVTLELVLDASGMQTGARQATAALDSVQATAAKTTQTVGSLRSQMSNAFQATGGTIQIAGGIAQTAKAFGDLNLAAAGFSASRSLLEIGRTVQDFRELRGAIGGTTGVMATLGAVMRAHPLLTIAGIIGAAASVMSLFGSETSKASSEFDRLASSMRKAKLDEETARYLGISPLNAQRAQLDQLFAGTATALGSSQGATLAQVQEMLGAQSRGALLGQLQGLGNREALSVDPNTGQFSRTTTRSLPGGRSFDISQSLGTGDVRVSASELRELFRDRYRSLLDQTATAGLSGGGGSGVYQFGRGRSTFANDVIGAIPSGSYSLANDPAANQNYVEITEEHRREMEDSAREVADEMARAAESAGQIGATIGAAFADVLLKTGSLREVFTSLLAQSVRGGLSQAGSAIFQGLSASFGATGTQGGQNARKPGGE